MTVNTSTTRLSCTVSARLFVGGALAALAGTACVPTPRGPIDLHRVEAKVVHFGLGPRSAICPGESVRLNVFLDVVDADDPDGVPYRLVPHRHEIDDAIFDFRQLQVSSPNGTFDPEGTFHPDPDVRTSVQTGFVIHARPPNGPAFAVRFPPSYECTARIGGVGRTGVPGEPGRDATVADRNDTMSSAGGGPPASPAVGGPGQAGGAGADGPSVTVFVTWVKTPDYTKLLAARAVGEVDRLTLVAPGSPLEVFARGGDGGPGGPGGQGAIATGPAETGGMGGQGGTGGAGGNGGSVHVVLDERFDDLEGLVSVDVRGGSGGRGGMPGTGGSGAVEDRKNSKGNYALRVRTGQQGPPGAYGPVGTSGDHGRVAISRGLVRPRFEGLGAIVPL